MNAPAPKAKPSIDSAPIPYKSKLTNQAQIKGIGIFYFNRGALPTKPEVDHIRQEHCTGQRRHQRAVAGRSIDMQPEQCGCTHEAYQGPEGPRKEPGKPPGQQGNGERPRLPVETRQATNDQTSEAEHRSHLADFVAASRVVRARKGLPTHRAFGGRWRVMTAGAFFIGTHGRFLRLWS